MGKSTFLLGKVWQCEDISIQALECKKLRINADFILFKDSLCMLPLAQLASRCVCVLLLVGASFGGWQRIRIKTSFDSLNYFLWSIGIVLRYEGLLCSSTIENLLYR